jgi:(heptosyl)LPS beta-1,4-glucosyltransferase
MASRDKISIVLVTFNEERNIEECLDSAKWADEIIVVDSFSTDRTLEFARRYQPRIFQRPWPGFGKQKNFALQQASMDWILLIDADERITEELRREIENLLASSSGRPVAYRVARKNYFYGYWLGWGGQFPDWQTRLYRKGIGSYDHTEPHEGFIFEGELGTLQNPLIHYTERRISDHFPKLNLYSSLAAAQRAQTCKKVHGYDLIFRPLITFYQFYLRKQGFRDGIPGLIQATFKSFYTFVKYAKVWEIHQQKEGMENAHRD